MSYYLGSRVTYTHQDVRERFDETENMDERFERDVARNDVGSLWGCRGRADE